MSRGVPERVISVVLTLALVAASPSPSQDPPKTVEKVLGRVFDAQGAPVARTRVIVITREEMLATTSDDTGRFFLALPPSEVLMLFALQPGRMPAELDLRTTPAPPPATGYTLTFAGAAGHITGHVVDASGSALAGWNVAALDEEPLWAIEYQMTMEEFIRGEDGAAPKVYAKTGADGSFRIDGLVKPAYDLLAWEPKTLANASASGVALNSASASLELPADALVRDFVARVVTAKGDPVPHAKYWINLETGPTSGVFRCGPHGTNAFCCETSVDGSLHLPVFPLGNAQLEIRGEGIRTRIASTTVILGERPNIVVEEQ